MKRIITFFILFFAVQVLYAQSKQQAEELKAIKSEIDSSNQKIAHDYAYIQMYDYFKIRTQYIDQINSQCLDLFTDSMNLAQNLSNSNLFSTQYSSPAQAYAALEVLTDLSIQDNITLKQISEKYAEFNRQKENLKDVGIFLNLDDRTLLSRFQRPVDLDQDYGYNASLIKAYHELVAKYGDQIKNKISKCSGSNWNINSSIKSRDQMFGDFFKKLADYYVKNSTEEYMQNLENFAKPSAEFSLMLTLETVFNGLDKRYRDAALYEKDYLKSMSFIDSYKNLSNIIMARIFPLDANDKQREKAATEIQRRIQKAQDFKSILNKEPKSAWLQKRYNLISQKINTGALTCSNTCKVHLGKVPNLITATKIVEDISNDNIYFVLGNQALDNAIR